LEFVGSNPWPTRRWSHFDIGQPLYPNENVLLHSNNGVQEYFNGIDSSNDPSNDSNFLSSFHSHIPNSMPFLEHDIIEMQQSLSDCYPSLLSPLDEDNVSIQTENNVHSPGDLGDGAESSAPTLAALACQTHDSMNDNESLSEQSTCVASSTCSPKAPTVKEDLSVGSDFSEDCDSAGSGGEEKGYTCDHPGCGKVFRKRFEKKKHVNIKHNHRYICQTCNRAFGVKRDMDRHTADKHPEINPQESIFCPNSDCKRSKMGFKRTRKDNLLRHLRKVHKWDEELIKNTPLA